MRPHEEEWTIEEGSTMVSCGLGIDDSGVFYGKADVAAGRAKLAHAAPDMARALNAFLSENGHTPDCGGDTPGRVGCSEGCAGARAALTKAGVL